VVRVTPDALRERLSRILAKTASARNVEPLGWWLGDRAAERRVADDLTAGRIHFLGARENAEHGLEALDGGDLELASAALDQAELLYVAALECRVRPKDITELGAAAKRRGRPSAARDPGWVAQYVAIVDELRAKDMSLDMALLRARSASPELTTALAQKTTNALAHIYKRGKKTQANKLPRDFFGLPPAITDSTRPLQLRKNWSNAQHRNTSGAPAHRG
jgi:hypothetical protein